MLTLNEETFLSASRGLRWGPDGWFGTNAACEEPRDSKPRFFFVWEFCPQYLVHIGRDEDVVVVQGLKVLPRPLPHSLHANVGLQFLGEPELGTH